MTNAATPVTVSRHGLRVAAPLAAFIESEVLPGTGIDERHRARARQPHDQASYRSFLTDIGYLVPEGPAFEITTVDVDDELKVVAGPQLVVPVTNARYALNATDARWGSLNDALYGTDALGDLSPSGPYNTERGARVIAWARRLLDDAVPLASGSHADVVGYRIVDSALVAAFSGEATSPLRVPAAFTGHRGDAATPTGVLLTNHGLRIEIVIDRSHSVGVTDPAGIADVVLESAVTTIIDFEDSIAAVDADDKVRAYRNWLGLMDGTLIETVSKGTKTFERRLAPNRAWTGANGSSLELRGRSVLLARNVGHLMTTPAVRDANGDNVFEGLLDAMVTVVIAMHDRNRPTAARNSAHGSVYIVKPKMHGPDEVAFACEMFTVVERALGLEPDTVKMGIMDEERRTTVNLFECVRAARSRVVFINTGFLDRTGDEIHTSMEAGPMVPKAQMKSQPWITGYEDHNVDIGLRCGFSGRAQVGKGMWAAPNGWPTCSPKREHPRLRRALGRPGCRLVEGPQCR